MGIMMGEVVYFIADEKNQVKIGRTCTIYDRFLSLQRVNEDTLTLLAIIPGYRQKEKELHKRFSHLQNGDEEWFEADLELISFIREMNFPPKTFEEVRQARFKIKSLFGRRDKDCTDCGEPIWGPELLFLESLNQYERFVNGGIFLCLSCYNKRTSHVFLIDRIVWASLQRPPDFDTVIPLLVKLHN